MVFTHWKLLPRISVQACNNAEKWTPGAPKTTPRPLETLQNPARRLRNRRRSASRRSKIGQGRQQTQQETQNALKKHPRSKNGANMAPMDLRKLRMLGPPSRRTPPPIGTYSRYSINFSDTPGHLTAGAEDFGRIFGTQNPRFSYFFQ